MATVTQEADVLLSKRAWLLSNVDFILNQVTYHKTHHPNFQYKAYMLWKIGEKEGRLSLGEVVEYVD